MSRRSFAAAVATLGACAAALLACLAGAAAPAGAAPPFVTGATIPSSAGTTPSAVAVGDVNADGRQDLVAGVIETATTAGIYVWVGGADGGFTLHDRLTATRDVADVALGDLDRDGDLDVVVADPRGFAANDVAVFLGAGDGGFSAPDYVDLPESPRSLALGDFDGDQRLDLAAATGLGVTVRFGDGSGGFTGTASVGFAEGAKALTLGDFTADGRLDIAASTFDLSSQLGLLTNGGGTFTSQRSALADCSALPCVTDLATGDFDENGTLDAAAAVDRGDGSALVLRLGAGDGRFRDDRPAVPVGRSPKALAAGDFDGDGHVDLASAGFSGTVSVRLGNGDGTFRNAGEASVGVQLTSIAIGDLDENGAQDLVVGTNADNLLRVLRCSWTAPLSGNLLANGGFERGAGAGTAAQRPAIPDWIVSGGMTFARYGMAPDGIYPTLLDAPRLSGGRNFLWGGTGATTSTAFQTVDVSGYAGAIDVGLAAASLSAWLGGAGTYADHMRASATFLNGSGTVLGSFEVGPVAPAQRFNRTTLLRRAGSAAVPAGTRWIRVTLTSTDTDTISSATADNVKLTLATTPTTAPGTPATPTGFGAQTLVNLRLASGKVPAKGPLVVRVSNGNAFAVSGSLAGKVSVKAGKRVRAIKLRAKAVRVAASASATVKLALPKALQRVLARTGRLAVRFTLTVRDPAGTSRTVTAKLTVRRTVRR